MKRLKAAVLTMGGVWLLAASGCNSESLEDDRVPAERFGAMFAKALCDNASRCCERSDFNFDQTNCEGRLRTSFQARVDELLTDLVDYHEVGAGECLARMKAESGCGASLLDFPDCDAAFQGQLADGQTCQRNETCNSGWCSIDGLSDGRCQATQYYGPVVAGGAGDACVHTCREPGSCGPMESSGTPTVCYRSEGLFCSYDDSTQTAQCERLLDVGQPCQDSWDCKVGLFCEGVCEAPHPNGASCGYDDECRSGACLDGECVESALTEDQCTSGGVTNF